MQVCFYREKLLNWCKKVANPRIFCIQFAMGGEVTNWRGGTLYTVVKKHIIAFDIVPRRARKNLPTHAIYWGFLQPTQGLSGFSTVIGSCSRGPIVSCSFYGVLVALFHQVIFYNNLCQVMEFSKPFKYQGITILQKRVSTHCLKIKENSPLYHWTFRMCSLTKAVKFTCIVGNISL